jgi:hypothetical protein
MGNTQKKKKRKNKKNKHSQNKTIRNKTIRNNKINKNKPQFEAVLLAEFTPQHLHQLQNKKK